MSYFFLAIMTFTRIPLPKKWFRFSYEYLYKSMVFFPVVGALVAGICMLFFVFMQDVVSYDVLVCMVLVFSVLLTGAYHEDGFADYCDSFGGYDKEKCIAIMKDSRLGTFGVLGLIFLMGMKFLLLRDMSSSDVVVAFFASMMLARLCVMPVLISYPYVGHNKETEKKLFTSHILSYRFGTMILAFILTIFPLMFFISWYYVLGVFIITQIFLYVVSYFMTRRLGGMTGDTGGAIEQLGEVFVLLLFSLYGNILVSAW